MGRAGGDARRGGAGGRCLPTRSAGTLPRHPQPRGVRKGASLQRRHLPDAVGKAGGQGPHRAGGLEQPLPVVGSDRPGALGAPRICRGEGGLARRRPLTGGARPSLTPGVRGRLRQRHLGWYPAVEHRKGRHHGDLVLRGDGLGGGGTQPRAPCRNRGLGGLQRPLPRCLLPRRHPQRVHPPLAAQPDRPDPVRAGRAGSGEPEHRAFGGGRHHAVRR